MKQILLPTDFSEASMNAVHYCIDLFEGEDVNFVLVNCFEEPVSGGAMLISIRDILEKDSKRQLEQIRKGISPRLSSNQSVEIISYFGRIERGVLELAEKKKVFMIVMGTTGASGIKGMLFGSNAAGISKDATCTVLSIPSDFKYKRVDHIVFATDLGEIDAKKVLEPLHYILRRQKSMFTVLRIEAPGVEINTKKTQAIIDYFQEFNPETVIERNDSVPEGFKNYLKENNPDLIVIVSREHTGLRAFFTPRLTGYLVGNSQVPILSLHG